MFFRPIAPFVARANPGAAKKIQAVLTPGAAVPPNTLAIVKPALESTYAKLDIEPSDIGAFLGGGGRGHLIVLSTCQPATY
jgi:hypothetical protein